MYPSASYGVNLQRRQSIPENPPMWITRKTDYATRAVLALAIHGRETPLSVQELADRIQVSGSYLEQIMAQLRGAGIVRAERGPAAPEAGGWWISRCRRTVRRAGSDGRWQVCCLPSAICNLLSSSRGGGGV